jgi:hypothetical protein
MHIGCRILHFKNNALFIDYQPVNSDKKIYLMAKL